MFHKITIWLRTCKRRHEPVQRPTNKIYANDKSYSIQQVLVKTLIISARINEILLTPIKLSSMKKLCYGLSSDIACQFELYVSKTFLVGMELGPWYIKPWSVHSWDQFSDVVLREDGERWNKMFKVSMPTFYYICGTKRGLGNSSTLGLHKIRGRYLLVMKEVAFVLQRLATMMPFWWWENCLVLLNEHFTEFVKIS